MEEAIEVVKGYGEYLEDIFCQLSSEYSSEEMSYVRWAISELLERLEHCLPGDELLTMEKLSDELATYSRLSSRNGHMFLVAYETVNCAIDLCY